MKVKLKSLLQTYKDLSAPAKASIWFLICNILQMGLSVLTTPVFTRIMSKEEYGVTNVYNSWRSILMIFTSLNLSYGVFNNAMVKNEDSKTRDQYVSCMQGLYCMITVTFFAFYMLFQPWCNSKLHMSSDLVYLLFLDLLFYPALLFWSGRQRYEFKYRWLVVVTLAMSVCYVGVGIVAVLLSENKAFAKIASGVAVNVLFCGFFLVYHFVKGRRLCIPKFWKYALAFNIPLVPHYLSEMILTQSDRIMIERYEDTAATASYSIAYSIVLIMQMVMSAINASFLPWAYGCLKAKNYQAIRKMGNMIVVLVAGCVFLLMMFTPEVIFLFAGDKYMDAIYCIPPIALSIFFISLYDLFSTVEFYFEKNIFVMIASIIAAAMNVVLNMIFIPMYGYYAAGYTTLFCYMMYAIGHYVIYRIICKKTLQEKGIYDTRMILFMASVMFAITLLVTMTYDIIWLRYLLAFIVMGVIVWKRNYLIDRIKMMREKNDSAVGTVEE